MSTGCNSIDELLRGGWRNGQVTEVVGPSASGKTQMCLQAALMFARNEVNVLFVDTHGSFSSDRIDQIAQQRYVRNRDAILQRIHVLQLMQIEQVFGALDNLFVSNENQGNYQCLIIDSLPPLLSAILGDSMQRGQALMAILASLLRAISCEYGITILVCNYTLGDSRSGKVMLGEDWNGQCHTRIRLDFVQNGHQRIATLLTSTYLESGGKVAFQIGDAGVFSN
eukprot:TRINITY_DN11610_c1_g1_i1.p1 TRINITY_DN11610_c1_g1~~TRINITY_DN11610_c1_g1_i1.p1  ORF type:complete len:225 (-),score=24.64 TRINITY_DN11610_c1_g1_i1:211-885(-)